MSGKKQQDVMKLKGEIVDVLPNTQFDVKIQGTDRVVRGYISGKMRRFYIRLSKGDTVDIEVTPYDLNRGRIVYRNS